MDIRGAFLDALAVIAPIECAGCARPDRALCVDCASALVPHVSTHELSVAGPVWAALAYDGAVRRVILAFKEHDRTDARLPLARALAAAVDQATATTRADAVVAVPSSRAGLRRRGYDPVASLLTRSGVRPLRALVPARAGSAQKSLSLAARRANREGSLRARFSLAGVRVLLVDDILTTGATLDEAARAVGDAGGEVCGAAVLAFTPKLLTSQKPVGRFS